MKNVLLVCEAQVTLQEKGEADRPSGRLEARVTTWGAREGADGRKFNYQPEGFSDWAAEFAALGKPLPMFLNHNDIGMPVGEWTSFAFDEDGMTANGRLYLNTAGGADLYHILGESPTMFGGVSVGAYADEARFVTADGAEFDDAKMGDDEAYFQIIKGGLREVSVVMYPNNPNAGISKLECFGADGEINPRVLERVLRDAGLHKKDATTASSIFKRVMAERDAPKTPEATPNQGDPDAVVNEALLRALELRDLAKALETRI